jgi:lipopolysaccharide/colanic/teichoic acid biosynthesis glycosyltransferase
MHQNSESDTQWSVDDDARVTKLGHFMRKTSLDELPQLWNVVRGDMSLVGPRPERPHFVQRFSEEVDGYEDRHRVPVGLTGLAQVNGLRGDTSIEDRAWLDNQYIENWSAVADLAILARTAGAMVRQARE